MRIDMYGDWRKLAGEVEAHLDISKYIKSNTQ
jgi:hypothetical protein